MSGDELTIEQLAIQVGMTVRNIRAHQARGLLAPPRIKGRVGIYGPAHRRRLEQIQAMQAEGLNLAAIARVLNDGQLTAITTELFVGSQPAWFAPDELVQRLGVVPGDGVEARAHELGLIAVDGDRIRMDLPGLLPMAEEFSAMGVPIAAQVEALGQVQAAVAQVAATYVRLADEHLVARVAADSGGDLDALRSSVARLRDLARLALTASFNQAMSEALREHFEDGATA